MTNTTETVKLIGGLLVIAALVLLAQYVCSRFFGVNPFYVN